MSGGQCSATLLVLVVAVLASGCGTPREKTAPCKRPANLMSYATTENDCGPMRLINPDRAVALAAIQELATVDKK